MALANLRIEPFNDSLTKYHVYLDDTEIGRYVTSVNIELLPGDIARVCLGIFCKVEIPSNIRAILDIHTIELTEQSSTEPAI